MTLGNLLSAAAFESSSQISSIQRIWRESSAPAKEAKLVRKMSSRTGLRKDWMAERKAQIL